MLLSLVVDLEHNNINNKIQSTSYYYYNYNYYYNWYYYNHSFTPPTSSTPLFSI